MLDITTERDTLSPCDCVTKSPQCVEEVAWSKRWGGRPGVSEPALYPKRDTLTLIPWTL